MTSLEEMQARLFKLEKQNLRFKKAGGAIMGIVAMIVVMGQAQSKKTVEANEFILRDEVGNVRARLFMTKKSTTTAKELFGIDDTTPVTVPPEATLTLYDDKGQIKSMLDGSNISFLNSGGHLGGLVGNGVLSLQGDKDGSFAMLSPYSLNISDEEGFSTTIGTTNLVTRKTGETQKTSAASLVLFDKAKNVIWKAP